MPAFSSLAFSQVAFSSAAFSFDSSGSSVTFFRGLTKAGGIANHRGLSRPTLALVATGGGTYTVTKTHQLHAENPGTVSNETYLIDNELP